MFFFSVQAKDMFLARFGLAWDLRSNDLKIVWAIGQNLV